MSVFLSAINLPNDRVRASFGFREDLGQIDSHDTNEGNDQTTQQPDGSHNRSPSAKWLGKKHPIAEEINRVSPRDERDCYPDVKDADQRYVAERGDGVHKQRHLAAKVVSRLACAVFLDSLRALVEASDMPQACHEYLSFVMAQQ